MIINDQKSVEIISSNEGGTQGDVTAMPKYAVGIKPLIDHLGSKINKDRCVQCWFADDSSAGGTLPEIRIWWDELCHAGPRYGYYPLPRKTILIVKEEFLPQAEEIFRGTGITISSSGERHMGAWVGSQAHKEIYVTEKVDKWIEDVEELARLAVEEPQAVYSCYTKAISHRWSYVQRTIPGISHLFMPLEEVIREKLIPALVGRKVNDIERQIFTLPVRMGGMNILNPIETAEDQFQSSAYITQNLAQIIKEQHTDLTHYDEKDTLERIEMLEINLASFSTFEH